MIKIIGPYRPAIAKMQDGKREVCEGREPIEIGNKITLKDIKWIQLRHKKRKFKVKGKSGRDYIITVDNKQYMCTCKKEKCSHIKKVKEKINAS